MSDTPKPKINPFRRAVLRGLGIIMPPLLTVVLFVWAWQTLDQYVLVPVEGAARLVMMVTTSDIVDELPSDTTMIDVIVDDKKLRGFRTKGNLTYVRLPEGRFIPDYVYEKVSRDPGSPAPANADSYYDRYIRINWLKRRVVVPVFFCVFILVLYILGKFFAAGMGRIVWSAMEALIQRLPLIRNVYSSVKQVTDFMFSESEIEYTRVVAVEYPRKGIWSVGFVTGESMLDIRAAANESVLSVLMPTSPMPATGFTVTVLKSETIDLDLSIDQALQFVVSCGVVVPLQQQQVVSEISSRIAAAIGDQHSPVVDPAKLPHSPGSENGTGDSNDEKKNNGSTTRGQRGNREDARTDQHDNDDE